MNQSNWVEKYRPKKFEEVKGQNLAIEKVKSFVKNFGKGKKALILHGPPGTGKTTIAHAAGKELGAEIFELNASDLRDKARLKEVLKPAIEQQSLIKTKKIILVDEADGVSSVDRGGLTELLSLITISTHPIIITANDIWDKRFSSLRTKSELVQLKELDYKTTKDILIEILRKENNFLDLNILTSISVKAKGDLRAAINDLQTAAKTPGISAEDFAERNKETDIFNALRRVFKEKPTEEILSVFDSVNMPIDEVILWVEENIPMEYREIELAKAYERLSKTDIFKGRIYKQQYWRFLVYENFLLSYGISASKKDIKKGFTSYKKPSRILKIWMNNQKIMSKKAIAIKYSRLTHIGSKRALNEFPVIKRIILSNEKIQKELKLTEEELKYLNTKD